MDLRAFVYRWYTTFVTAKGGNIPFTDLANPLNQTTIAIITTAGVRLNDQVAFTKKGGDHSFRIIPGDVDPADLVPDHTHYNTAAAQADVDTVFPIRTLTTLTNEGIVGRVSPVNIGFMGYIPDTDPLIKESIPAVIKLLKQAGVGAVLLSPG